MSIRESDFYKNLTPCDATMLCEGVDSGSEEQIITAWQYLHDTGLAYSLQGWFGRACASLLEGGVIER